MSEPLKPGDVGARIVHDEERLLARVLARAALPDDESERVGAADMDKDLIELRDAIGEAKPEDVAPLVEQMTRIALIRGRIGGSRVLPVDLASPYFAHMAVREGDKPRDVLIGKRGFIDRKANVQIVDWRNAPISQIYYRYDEGDDYDDEVEGRKLAGVVEIRRNLSIQKSVLRRIGAPQGTFVRDREGVWHAAVGSAAPVLQGGQGSAARAPTPAPLQRQRGGRGGGRLGVHGDAAQRPDKHLPEIAALIDREQFELISQPSSGLVVIQGGAGSGKTTVALHRIAYLSFQDPQRFKPSRMLFVVPAEALVRYVAAVLPALGVDKVPVVTYHGWAKATRQKLLAEGPSTYTGGAPDAVARLKKHPLLLGVLERYVADQVAEAERELAAALAGLEGGERVLAAWNERGKRTPRGFPESDASRVEVGVGRGALVPRLRRLYRWIDGAALPAATKTRAASVVKALGQRADDVVEDWAEVLTDRSRLAVLVDRGAARAHELDGFIKWCAAQQEEAIEVPVDDAGRAIESIDGHALDEGDTGGRLDEEDDPILLRLVQLKRGGLAARTVDAIEYEHVAIDEAQDRSAIEIKVLLDAVRLEGDDPARRSATIAGDTAQRLVFDNHFASWAELLLATGYAAAAVRPLRLSYRSTAEVMRLARAVLGPDLAPDEPLHARAGAPVELYELGDVGEAVAFLGDALRGLMNREPSASVAVIARFPEQADAYAAGLTRAEVPSLRRVRRQDFSFAAGVDVTDVAQVKGLEFDYVVMVDVNAAIYPDTVECRHMLHIGMTRAAHQLWLVSTGEVSPLLSGKVAIG